jgi:hypothetical protein
MSSNGAVSGSVRNWLRTEGIAVVALAVVLYAKSGRSWWIFAALLLAPDLFMLFYLINAKVGALAYNVVHSYVFPLIAAALMLIFDRAGLLPYVLIWVAHIGMDRSLGYGLKYKTAFARTHLGELNSGPGRLVNHSEG